MKRRRLENLFNRLKIENVLLRFRKPRNYPVSYWRYC